MNFNKNYDNKEVRINNMRNQDQMVTHGRGDGDFKHHDEVQSRTFNTKT